MTRYIDIDEFDEDAVLEILEDTLDGERYRHSLHVRDFALKLAKGKAVKRNRVVAAALLHDIAKDMEIEEMFRYAASRGIAFGPGQILNNKTLHQNVGAAMVREEFGITDAQVLSAIGKHATADAHMSLLDTIIYLADSLEESRDYEGVEALRELALRDLDEAYYQILRRTMIYVLERSLYIDERSVRAYNHACLNRVKGKDNDDDDSDDDD